MIARRTLFVASLVAPTVGRAQSPQRVVHLSMSSDGLDGLMRVVRARLRELGLAEGRDVVFSGVSADGDIAALPRLIADLAPMRPAAVVASGGAIVRAMRDHAPDTATVGMTGDLVAMGVAQSFARPGGRITGVSFIGDDLNAKRLEILAEMIARPTKVLQLADPAATSPAGRAMAADVASAVTRLGLELVTVEAGDAPTITRAIDMARAQGATAVNVLASPRLNSLRRLIFARAEATRLPAIYQWPESARDGGLIAYGPSLNEIYRQLAGQLARILRGTPPGEIPIEQPTRFELVINQRAAAAIGFTFPPALVALADEVIE